MRPKQQVHDIGDDDMKKGAGMGGRSAVGHGAARRAQRSERRAGPLRGCALFLAALMMPGAALGEQTASEKLKEQLDHRLWKEVGGCPGAERYLKALPEGLHADEARECLEAEKEEKEEMRRRMKGYEEGAYKALERGNVARARRRLEELRKLDEMAPEVMDLEDAIAEAEERLGKMREYAETGREALERGDLKKARRYVERMRGLDEKAPEVMDLEEAVAEAEQVAEARGKKPGTTLRDCPECPEMVVVPPGGPTGRSFAVGVYEVTFSEWDACVWGGGCGGYRPDDEGWGRGKRPAINVSWNDAQQYVRWLSGRTGEAYRLPSDAEWEYVARAGATTEYWWGNDIGRNRANCHGCGSRWDGRQSAPVGSFSANPFGLHDVHGNVWEWVEVCWEGDCSRRVLRGGSWNLGPRYLRSAYRLWNPPGNRVGYVGFRVARTLTP